MKERRGILAGGNFIVDQVKIVDAYPAPEMLASIVSQSKTNGGGPYNVLTDLARLGVDAPLEAVGLVGDDGNGRWILDDCRASGIGTTQLHSTTQAATSYTDVMSVADSGQRTFFHQSGTNALLDPEHFDFSHSRARVFHLAYLLLLAQLDKFDEAGKSFASYVLEAAQAHGHITSADLVSIAHPKAAQLVASAAPHLDYLLLNEVEAGRIVGHTLRGTENRPLVEKITDAAASILRLGVKREVVIHFAQGAVSYDAEAGPQIQGAVSLPEGFNQGSVGAGDAFAAGYLWAVHEGVDAPTRLRWAACVAAMSLSHPTPSLGVKPLDACLALGTQYGFDDTPHTYSPTLEPR